MGCRWLDPYFITNSEFAVNAVMRLVMFRFIVQKRNKPFVVEKFRRKNNALITPGCEVVPKYTAFDASVRSRAHSFDCPMITINYPIAATHMV